MESKRLAIIDKYDTNDTTFTINEDVYFVTDGYDCAWWNLMYGRCRLYSLTFTELQMFLLSATGGFFSCNGKKSQAAKNCESGWWSTENTRRWICTFIARHASHNVLSSWITNPLGRICCQTETGKLERLSPYPAQVLSYTYQVLFFYCFDLNVIHLTGWQRINYTLHN